MSDESASHEGKNFRIPGRLHPVTEIDMSHGLPAEQLAGVPVCGFVRHEVVHDVVELDFSGEELDGMLDVSFLRSWHQESCRLLVKQSQGSSRAGPIRGPILE